MTGFALGSHCSKQRTQHFIQQALSLFFGIPFTFVIFMSNVNVLIQILSPCNAVTESEVKDGKISWVIQSISRPVLSSKVHFLVLLASNVSRNADSITYLGRPFHTLIDLSVWKFFLTFLLPLNYVQLSSDQTSFCLCLRTTGLNVYNLVTYHLVIAL